jgi:hypothetical protein
MKWSELPEVYRNLDLGDVEININEETNKPFDCIQDRFNWGCTPQGFEFWAKCFFARSYETLPLINPEWIDCNYCPNAYEHNFIKKLSVNEIKIPSAKLKVSDIKMPENPDPVNHPSHYGGENNPYEAIKIIEAHNLGFHLGNAVKYILRAGKKGDASEDIKKAIWYLERELKKS